jgi:hypothetical protein
MKQKDLDETPALLDDLKAAISMRLSVAFGGSVLR